MWLNVICLQGLSEGKYACTWKQIANLQGYTGHHEGREALYGVGWLTVGPDCFNPGKETRLQMCRSVGGPHTGRKNTAFFGVRTP